MDAANAAFLSLKTWIPVKSTIRMSVANYLIANGIQRNRLIIKSYGEERPLSLGSNNSAWSKNRRVEIK